MSNTLHKSEILRGYDIISKVMRIGTRVNTTLLECRVVATLASSGAPGADRPLLRVAFAVPKKKAKLATDRNRVRRLLREACRKNRAVLQTAAGARNLFIDIVILFSGSLDVSPRRLSYRSVEAEWNKASEEILALMGRQ